MRTCTEICVAHALPHLIKNNNLNLARNNGFLSYVACCLLLLLLLLLLCSLVCMLLLLGRSRRRSLDRLPSSLSFLFFTQTTKYLVFLFFNGKITQPSYSFTSWFKMNDPKLLSIFRIAVVFIFLGFRREKILPLARYTHSSLLQSPA